MKIYFACSIAGGRDHSHLYPDLVQHLRKHGKILTEMFSNDNIREIDSKHTDHEIFTRDMDWIKDSTMVVAEVSTPSLGVGFEIATALNQGKKVLCLFKNQDSRMLSAMIAGNKNLHIIRYSTIEEAKQKIDKFFQFLPKP